MRRVRLKSSVKSVAGYTRACGNGAGIQALHIGVQWGEGNNILDNVEVVHNVMWAVIDTVIPNIDSLKVVFSIVRTKSVNALHVASVDQHPADKVGCRINMVYML